MEEGQLPNSSFADSLNVDKTIDPIKVLMEKLKFFGKGSTYFGIVALNVILTVLTFGLYYPWAKAAYRKYLWNETEFKDSRFVFNGTGREMFKGFVIAYIIIIGFYGSFSLIAFYSYAWIFTVFFFVLLLLLIPFAIYGAWRYRVTRTSWRGIFFSFDGQFKPFLKIYIKGLLLSIVSFGIYSAWMRVSLQKYLFQHTRIGDLKLDFHGQGVDLFVINLLGYFLSYITIGLYLPIYIKKRFEFTINHTTIEDGSKRRALVSTLENGEAWKIIMSNFLLLIVTLGLAFPWTMMRSMRMFFGNIEIPNEFNFDELSQSPDDYRDATGDEMTDILDIGIDF